jgi:HEAT repeat protein
MGFPNRIFKKYISSTSKPNKLSMHKLKRIKNLEHQLCLPQDIQTTDGVYTGQEAEQYLQERGIQRPPTSLPLQVIDISRMGVVDKNLEARTYAAKELGRIGGRASLVALENVSHKISEGVQQEHESEVLNAISQSIEDIIIVEVKRQGGQEALQTYQKMRATVDESDFKHTTKENALLLFDKGIDWFFGSMGIPDSYEFLQRLLISDEFQIRHDAVEKIGDLGIKYSNLTSQIVALLAQSLKSDVSPEVRSAAAHKLGSLGGKYHTLVPQILGMLSQSLKSDVSPDVRSAAAWGLGCLREKEVLTSLLQSLMDPDINVRKSALNCCKDWLSQIIVRRDNHPYSVHEIEILKQGLSDPDPTIQEFATDQLIKIGEVKAMEKLLEFRKAPEAKTREKIATKLGEFRDVRAISTLVDMLNDPDEPDEFVRVLAARSLGRVGDLSVIEILVKTMTSVREDVRFYFTDAIEEIRERSNK